MKSVFLFLKRVSANVVIHCGRNRSPASMRTPSKRRPNPHDTVSSQVRIVMCNSGFIVTSP